MNRQLGFFFIPLFTQYHTSSCFVWRLFLLLLIIESYFRQTPPMILYMQIISICQFLLRRKNSLITEQVRISSRQLPHRESTKDLINHYQQDPLDTATVVNSSTTTASVAISLSLSIFLYLSPSPPLLFIDKLIKYSSFICQ